MHRPVQGIIPALPGTDLIVEFFTFNFFFLTLLLTNSFEKTFYNDCEKGDAMYYELYLDSLFFLNFVMNLYLLVLTNRRLMYIASRGRLLVGAAVGAGMSLLPFLMGYVPLLRALPAGGKLIVGFLSGSVIMIVITFRVGTLRMFCKVMEKMICLTFLMGGGLAVIKRILLLFPGAAMGIMAVLGAGALLAVGVGVSENRKEEGTQRCRVTLCNGTKSVSVCAILDTGNSLVEPISGKPVSVIERKTFEALYGEEETLYRAIPYHSIGRKRGIMKGFFLPEMRLEIDGITKICTDCIVAVSEEAIEGNPEKNEVKMIVNPMIIEKNREDGRLVFARTKPAMHDLTDRSKQRRKEV